MAKNTYMDIVAWYAGNLRLLSRSGFYFTKILLWNWSPAFTGYVFLVISPSTFVHLGPSGNHLTSTPDSRPPTINVLLNLLTQKPRRIVALHLTLNTNGKKNTGKQNICTKENTNTHKTTQNREIRHQQFPNIFW